MYVCFNTNSNPRSISIKLYESYSPKKKKKKLTASERNLPLNLTTFICEFNLNFPFLFAYRISLSWRINYNFYEVRVAVRKVCYYRRNLEGFRKVATRSECFPVGYRAERERMLTQLLVKRS